MQIDGGKIQNVTRKIGIQIWVCRSVEFPLLTGCRGGAPAPKRSAGGVGGGLERPDARGSARRFPIEKLLQNITNSITTRKFSCTFRCAPRRSRPVSLRLGHAAALDATGIHSLPRRRFATSGLPATVFGSGGFAPRPLLQRKPNSPINCNLKISQSSPKNICIFSQNML